MALADRVGVLSKAFRNIVFSQIRISALNTLLTAIYLVVVLPLFGIDLPFVRTMIAVTFIAGLLPVVGNLISNTVIVVVSFSISFRRSGRLACFSRRHPQARIFRKRADHRLADQGARLGAFAGDGRHGGMVRHPGPDRRADLLRLLKDELAMRGLI